MDVSFEEENRYAPAQPLSAQKGGLEAWVIRIGLAKDAKGVQFVFMATLIFCVAIIGFIWFMGGSDTAVAPDEYERWTTAPQSL